MYVIVYEVSRVVAVWYVFWFWWKFLKFLVNVLQYWIFNPKEIDYALFGQWAGTAFSIEVK